MRWRWVAGALVAFAASAAEQAVTLRIDGWHSSGDAYKTEVAVRGLKGVRTASADRTAKTLSVTFDDAQTTRAQVEGAVSAAGYAVVR